MTRLNDRSKLLEVLAETPIVSFACKKIGLDRRTYYRWYKDNKQFRDQVDDILTIGRKRINDMAESVILKKINEDDLRATIFWLQNNNPQYRPVRTTYVDPITHHHSLAPGEVCHTCGHIEPRVKEYKENEYMTNEEIAKGLYKRLRSLNTRKQSETEIVQMILKLVESNLKGNKIEFVDFSKDEPKKEDDR